MWSSLSLMPWPSASLVNNALLPLDLSDLDRQSEALVASMDEKLADLETKMPQLHLRQYLHELTSEFKERPFEPLDELWERELGDLFDDIDDRL